jgi:hypothetical protein
MVLATVNGLADPALWQEAGKAVQDIGFTKNLT